MKKVITKRPNGTIRVQTIFEDVSMADDTLANESDVNYIMQKYKKTGSITHYNKKVASYGDFTMPRDLQSAFEAVDNAKKAFSQLPAVVREKFKNNPVVLEQWLNDPKNLNEAVELGLINKPASNNDDFNDDKNSSASKKSKPQKNPAPQNTPDPE